MLGNFLRRWADSGKPFAPLHNGDKPLADAMLAAAKQAAHTRAAKMGAFAFFMETLFVE